jgi:cytochrome c oxidase assembly protein Cox11
MSDQVTAFVITVAIIALFFAWVPLLNFVCPPCGLYLERLRLQKEKDVAKARASVAVDSTLRP